MKISFRTKSKKNPASLYVRLYHSRDFDIWTPTTFVVDGKYWSNKKERVGTAASNRQEESFINKELPLLKNFILEAYNKRQKEGGEFTKLWLDDVIAKYTNHPTDATMNHEIFLVPFMEMFIEESKSRINISNGKPIGHRTIQKYRTTWERMKEFEKLHNLKLKHADIDLNFHQKFTSFLSVNKKYNSNTTGKYITNLKTFLREAKTLGYPTNPQFEHRNFTSPKESPIHIYLDLNEIKQIFQHQFKSDKLQNTRQLMIIGFWTGLRVSDLSRIQGFNFRDEVIEISDTKKTGANVRIPIHPQVKAILEENKGNLPRIISDVNYNKNMKEVCKEVGLTEIVMGSRKNPETNRNQKGYFPKYELVSSHTCRRSFATNHYGKLPNQTIMAITTHRSEKQFLSYVKTTHDQHIKAFNDYWSKNN